MQIEKACFGSGANRSEGSRAKFRKLRNPVATAACAKSKGMAQGVESTDAEHAGPQISGLLRTARTGSSGAVASRANLNFSVEASAISFMQVGQANAGTVQGDWL